MRLEEKKPSSPKGAVRKTERSGRFEENFGEDTEPHGAPDE